MIGGGVQGTFVSHVLSVRLGVSRDDIRVLDPHVNPLARWQQTTDACGMRFLRSPAAHHVGIRTNELLDWTRANCPDWRREYLQPYLRPSLACWNAHAKSVIDEHRLEEMRIRGSALDIHRSDDGSFHVQTSVESIHSKRIVLATGNSQPLHYPALPVDSDLAGERIRHLFDPAFRRSDIQAGENVVIVGSGVSAAQLAIRLAGEQGCRIQVLTDGMPQLSWFDSDPGWNGPRLLSRLAAIADPEERQRMVSEARIRGSFPGDTAASLLECTILGKMTMLTGRLESVCQAGNCVHLRFNDEHLTTDRLVFATGFSTAVPAAPLVGQLSARLGLPVSSCGWPVVNQYCEWAAGVLVCGALAQLELGPVSRNISGIRSFARRLVERYNA